MTRVLLHLGLPKTATTTLQTYAFPFLHEAKEINYLGKQFDKECHSTVIKDEAGFICRHVNGIVARDALSALDDILDPRRLNVYSDECIAIQYPGGAPFRERIARLGEAFSPYETTVLVTIREPVSLFYSMYIQTYPGFYQYDQGLNTIEKFVEFFRKNPDNPLFDMFRYDSVLAELGRAFPRVEVLVYEDMCLDLVHYVRGLARAFGLTEDALPPSLFEIRANARNRYVQTDEFIVQPSILSDKIGGRLGQLRKRSFAYRVISRLYHMRYVQIKPLWRMFLRVMSSVHVDSGIKHAKLNADQVADLREMLRLRAAVDWAHFGVDDVRLRRYGYGI